MPTSLWTVSTIGLFFRSFSNSRNFSLYFAKKYPKRVERIEGSPLPDRRQKRYCVPFASTSQRASR